MGLYVGEIRYLDPAKSKDKKEIKPFDSCIVVRAANLDKAAQKTGHYARTKWQHGWKFTITKCDKNKIIE